MQVALACRSPLVLLYQLVLVLAPPGKAAGDDVVEKDPVGEGVSFDGVYVCGEGLRRHIKRTSNQIFLFQSLIDVSELVGEAEVAQFAHSSLDEHVRRLYISVHDSAGGEVTTGQSYL
jgi:hypothetical protein